MGNVGWTRPFDRRAQRRPLRVGRIHRDRRARRDRRQARRHSCRHDCTSRASYEEAEDSVAEEPGEAWVKTLRTPSIVLALFAFGCSQKLDRPPLSTPASVTKVPHRHVRMTKVGAAEMPSEVTLLKEEGGMMAYCGAVTTITFFTGPAPVEAVRERLALVVAANPWLAGRLVRGKGEKRMRLTFDPAGPLRDGLLTVASPGQYKLQGVSYAAIQKVIKGSPLEVLGGAKAVLTRTSWGLRTVRTGYTHRPPASCKYRRRRAACPGAGSTVRRTAY